MRRTVTVTVMLFLGVCLLGCGSASTGTGGATSASTATAGDQLRFTAPVGTVMNLVTSTQSDIAVQLDDLTAEPGSGIPQSEVDAARSEFEKGLKVALDGKSTLHTSIDAPTKLEVVGVDADGSRHVVTTSTFDVPLDGKEQSITSHSEAIYHPDGSVTLGAIDIDGASGLSAAVVDVMKSAIRQAAEQDSTSAAYRLPLRAGASRTDDGTLRMAIPIPLPGVTSNTFVLTTHVKTTYVGPRDGGHVFTSETEVGTETPLLLTTADNDEIRSVAVSIQDGGGTSEVTAGADGRILAVTGNVSMNMKLVLALAGDAEGISASILFPMKTTIRVREVP